MSDKAVGTKTSAKEYQKQLMADQPAHRAQTPRTSAGSDARDTGKCSGSKGNTLTTRNDGPQDVREVKSPGKYFPK